MNLGDQTIIKNAAYVHDDSGSPGLIHRRIIFETIHGRRFFYLEVNVSPESEPAWPWLAKLAASNSSLLVPVL